ncbi:MULTISPECIES: hypothetical protein [Rhizobium]|uniref:hypothetical protein n=1 Tax=Rhizobium TaxID=379 RepID=UPI000B07B161|nr:MULTISPECIES: hypothetical protein [Rhizobium]MCA0802230.1 hypothetical protein [Rhizobium sp. T1473]MCS0458854.1 hypothetical protein [Rhizobium favelukesii]
MSTLNAIFDIFYAFRSRQITRQTRNRTRDQLARLPRHLADDLGLQALGMTPPC